jgi:peptidoglycan/LPS O-acetylase OafA/YrhL
MASARIAPIQWLRALAVTLVLVVHACELIDYGPVAVTGSFAPWVPNLAVFGASGVDLFFVISGFVMAQSLSLADRDPWRFLARRWLRIVPLFAGVSAVYMLILPDPPTVESALMSLTVLPIFDGAGYHYPALYVGWSLGFEFAFYALVALAMRAPRHRVATLLTLTIGVALAGVFLRPGWAPLRLLLNPLLLEFALGIAAWGAWRRGMTARLAAPALVAGVVLLIVGLGFGLGVWVSTNPEMAVAGVSGFARSWTWGLPWTLVMIGLIDTPPGGRAEPLVAAVGDASHSIYLVHPCLIVLLRTVGHDLPVSTPTVFVAAFVITATAMGLVVHRCVERPLVDRLTRRARPARAIPARA